MAVHQALYAAYGGQLQVDADADGSLTIRLFNSSAPVSGVYVFSPDPATTDAAIAQTIAHYGGQ